MSRIATGAGVWPETLLAGGEMGRRILEHDWSRTPLGPIGEWSTTLRSVVSLVVENSVPTILYWGDDLIALYNDAYRPLLGLDRDALGCSMKEIWPEALDTIEPVVARARVGEASLFHNMRFTLHRNGRPEEAWFDWGFSPVRDEAGTVVGVLNTTMEQTQRARSERGLIESEQRNRGIVESISDGLVGIDRNWRITYLNPRAEEIVRPLHRTPGDLVGREFWDAFPGQRGTIMEENFLRAMNDQETVSFEVYYPPLDGWFDVRAYPSREGISIYVLDITERKRSEQALRRSENLLQAVLDQMPSGVYVAEAPTGRILYHNAAAEQILGHPMIEAEDLAQYGVYHAVHPDGSRYSPAEHPLARSLFGESIERDEVTYRRGDGNEITLAVNAAPVRDEGGETILAVCTFHDITHLKRIQEDLRRLNETLEQQVQARTEQVREKEERFRRLVEASAASVWTSGPDGSLVEESPSWRAFTGQSLEESRGDGWLEAIHPDDRDMVRADWDRCVAEGGSQDLEHRVWNEETKSYRWVAGRAVPLRDAEGNVRGWVGMDVDIDERKRAEQRVRELAARLTVVEQEERRRIAQILHDDLQQMLHGIDVKLDIVMQDLKDEEQPDVLEDLKEARWWIAQGVTATRSLTADLSPPILGQENLTDALGWLCRHMRELHGLYVDMDAEQPFPLPDGDLRVLLFHVVRELLFNVKKHAGVSRAELDLEEMDGRLVIHVIDDGMGFDASNAWSGSEGALGFGLFSIQERLALLGGWLEIASAPDEGTHVRVFAPLGQG